MEWTDDAKTISLRLRRGIKKTKKIRRVLIQYDNTRYDAMFFVVCFNKAVGHLFGTCDLHK